MEAVRSMQRDVARHSMASHAVDHDIEVKGETEHGKTATELRGLSCQGCLTSKGPLI